MQNSGIYIFYIFINEPIKTCNNEIALINNNRNFFTNHLISILFSVNPKGQSGQT